jgi:hypothetical protein
MRYDFQGTTRQHSDPEGLPLGNDAISRYIHEPRFMSLKLNIIQQAEANLDDDLHTLGLCNGVNG